MALKCVTCGLLFRSRNELDWHIRQEHLQQRFPPTKDSRVRFAVRPSPHVRGSSMDPTRSPLHPQAAAHRRAAHVLELATVTALPRAAPSTCSQPVRSRAAEAPQRYSGTRLRPIKPFRAAATGVLG
jgi:hypothetical protein